jgi:hypothetical protein
MRSLWQIRDEVGCTYSLGASVNLDHRWPSLYLAKAKVCNAVMQQKLKWLYERLGRILSQELACPVEYLPGFGLPGFNIYRTPATLDKPGNIHCDRQYTLLDLWPPADFARTLSFTLPLALPRSGGGLNYWNVRFADAPSYQNRVEFLGFFENREPRYHEYTVGRLVVQHGEFFHQLAQTVSPGDDDERITLQGHGVHSGDGWLLYW